MSPSVYLYNETIDSIELYLGEFSTLQGLSLFDREMEIQLISFGAIGYKKYGWVTKDELLEFRDIGSMIDFLEKEGNIDIVDFKASLSNIGIFSTHDDCECHFKLESKRIALSVLNKILPKKERDMLINQLLNNQNLYITCDDGGNVSKFGSFDEYLESTASGL